MKNYVAKVFDVHITLAEETRRTLTPKILQTAAIIIERLEKQGSILLCGNGGSAADAQHIAAELTGRYLKKDRRPLSAVALTTDTSALTALANDFGFDQVFSRQVAAIGRREDVLIGISTSGNSANVLQAFHAAREIGIVTVLLTGGDGGMLQFHADHCLIVPSSVTPRIQEMHITIGHIFCDLIDRHFAAAD